MVQFPFLVSFLVFLLCQILMSQATPSFSSAILSTMAVQLLVVCHSTLSKYNPLELLSDELLQLVSAFVPFQQASPCLKTLF